MHVEAKSTDLDLRFDRESYLSINLSAREDKVALPAGKHDLERSFTDDKKKQVTIIGFLGRKKQQPSLVNINSQNGEVKITFIQTPNPTSNY